MGNLSIGMITSRYFIPSGHGASTRKINSFKHYIHNGRYPDKRLFFKNGRKVIFKDMTMAIHSIGSYFHWKNIQFHPPADNTISLRFRFKPFPLAREPRSTFQWYNCPPEQRSWLYDAYMNVFQRIGNILDWNPVLKLYNFKKLSWRFNMKHLAISIFLHTFASPFQG